jgi:Protein of unknown function (DUF3667)
MSTICKNCNHSFERNFCNACGQSADTHRINFHFLWHDLQHGFFHFDKGVLFTAKELFTRPGHSIREFIEGKRVKHFKPLSLVLLLAGISGFLYYFFHINILANNVQVHGDSTEADAMRIQIKQVSEWIAHHYALIALAQLPLLSFATYLVFRKSGYNFMEHLILNAFLTSQRIILHIIAIPVFILLLESSYLPIVSRIVDQLGWVLMLWGIIQFFNQQKWYKTGLQMLLCFIILAGIGFIAITLFVKFFMQQH